MDVIMDTLNEYATFIIPHYGTNITENKRYLNECLSGIFNQRDNK